MKKEEIVIDRERKMIIFSGYCFIINRLLAARLIRISSINLRNNELYFAPHLRLNFSWRLTGDVNGYVDMICKVNKLIAINKLINSTILEIHK